ncbi:MAG: hypothetical protein E7434_01990 [Ruminococcaceae bacterium]|nr:hypothetical protein [Oscillospiraceae bacterium]
MTQLELFQKMYAVICGGVDDALKQLPKISETLYARCILEKSLMTAEDLFIRYEETQDTCMRRS